MRHLLLLTTLSLVTACIPKDEEANGPTCEGTTTEVALDAATPIGVVPADVLAQVPASEDTTLTYADATSTDLTLTFTPGATARFVDLEAVYPEGGETTAIGIVCDDYVAIDTDFTFTSTDGVFAEALAAELQATADAAPSLSVPLDLATMGGTFDIDDYTDTTDYNDSSAWITALLNGDGTTHGGVDGQVSGEEPCEDGDACTAWAENVSVGSWGATEE